MKFAHYSISMMKHYLTIALLFISLGVHAELNKWVDAKGKVHYSDEPPPANAKVEPLDIPKDDAVSASAASAVKSIAEIEEQFRKERKATEAAAQKAAQQQEEARAKQRNCDTARNNLKVLEDSPRITVYDANGERGYMDDATRKQDSEQARKDVSLYCR